MSSSLGSSQGSLLLFVAVVSVVVVVVASTTKTTTTATEVVSLLLRESKAKTMVTLRSVSIFLSLVNLVFLTGLPVLPLLFSPTFASRSLEVIS